MKIAFVGNCQAVTCADILKICTRGATDTSIRGFHWLFNISNEDKAWISSADVLVRQVSREEAYAELVPESGRVIFMPLLAAQFLWPFAGKPHPENQLTLRPWRPRGGYQGELVDSQFLRILATRQLTAESGLASIMSAIDEYLELDYGKLLDLDRLFQMSIRKMRAESEKVGYDVSQEIERDFRTIPLFSTTLHPEAPLLYTICRRLTEQLGFGTPQQVVEGGARAALQGAFSAAVHPSVARHFNLGWVTDPPTCRYGLYGSLTLREFCVRMATLQPDRLAEIFWRLGTGIKSSNGEENEKEMKGLFQELEQAQQQHPRSAELRFRYGVVLMERGRHAEAVPHLPAAVRLDPHQPRYATSLEQALKAHPSSNFEAVDPTQPSATVAESSPQLAE